MPRTKGLNESKNKKSNGSKTVSKSGIKNNQSKKSKGGRPSAFKPEYVEQIELLSRKGWTLPMIAKELSVALSTLTKWRDDKADVFEAIKKGQYHFDSGRITKTMVEKALGMRFEEVTEEYIEIDGEYYIETSKMKKVGKDSNGNKIFKQVKCLVEGIKRRIVHKMIPPSDVLMMFWLQNRQPEEWKNVQRQMVEQKTTVEHTHTYDLSKLGRKELERLKSLVSKAQNDDTSESPGSGLRLSAS